MKLIQQLTPGRRLVTEPVTFRAMRTDGDAQIVVGEIKAQMVAISDLRVAEIRAEADKLRVDLAGLNHDQAFAYCLLHECLRDPVDDRSFLAESPKELMACLGGLGKVSVDLMVILKEFHAREFPRIPTAEQLAELDEQAKNA